MMKIEEWILQYPGWRQRGMLLHPQFHPWGRHNKLALLAFDLNQLCSSPFFFFSFSSSSPDQNLNVNYRLAEVNEWLKYLVHRRQPIWQAPLVAMNGQTHADSSDETRKTMTYACLTTHSMVKSEQTISFWSNNYDWADYWRDYQGRVRDWCTGFYPPPMLHQFQCSNLLWLRQIGWMEISIWFGTEKSSSELDSSSLSNHLELVQNEHAQREWRIVIDQSPVFHCRPYLEWWNI